MQSEYKNVYDRLWEFLFYYEAEKCGVYGYRPIIKDTRTEETPPQPKHET